MPMKWARDKQWGSIGSTYTAKRAGWSYCVDQPTKGHWELRGWNHGAGTFLYRHGFRTASAAKAAAEDHARTNQNVEGSTK